MTANGENVPGFSAPPISYLDMLLRENKPGMCVVFLPFSCVTVHIQPCVWVLAVPQELKEQSSNSHLDSHIFLLMGTGGIPCAHEYIFCDRRTPQNLAIIKGTFFPATWDMHSAYLSTSSLSSLLVTAPAPMWQQHGVNSLIVQRQHIFVQRTLRPLFTSCTWYLREQTSIFKK